MPTLRLSGMDLSIADVLAVARRRTAVALDRQAERRMSESAKVVAELAAHDAPVYGVNTGFGDLATVRIPIAELKALQRNLIRSHAAGVGDPLPVDVVRAVLLLRANTLASGRSGVRPGLAEMLLEMLDRGVHPVIPMHGSVGASGDLAPLAHAALVVIGEGEAYVDDVRMSGADDSHSEGVIDHLRAVEGTKVAALIRDRLGPGRGEERKVSLRATDDDVDVSRIARAQGGGGHRRAAGFTTRLGDAELVTFLRAAIAQQLA